MYKLYKLNVVITGLWIRIHFLRIRIQMWIRILSQPCEICTKLPYKVLGIEKDKKDCSEVKNHIVGPYVLNF